MNDMLYTKEFEKSFKHPELEECEYSIRNIGWSLGNFCPCKCNQCYSTSVRNKGCDITVEIIDRILVAISKLGAKTVNIGGNEPWFTNGATGKSLLPYILKKLSDLKVIIGITTSGISLLKLYKEAPEEFKLLNDVDISLDSPIRGEHNQNRNADVYDFALESLKIAQDNDLERSIIVCAMNWNFNKERIDGFLEIARKYNANIRFNMLKPMVPEHLEQLIDISSFYNNYSYLINNCETVDITEPRLSAIVNNTDSKRCPCGRTSLRIHSITPDGRIPVSPCVYLHDYKVGNLLKDDILDIVSSEPFKEFRRRNQNPDVIDGCKDCEYIKICGGGCAAKAYMYNLLTTGNRSIYVKEPNCPKDYKDNVDVSYFNFSNKNKSLVHMDYLCTWIGKPKN